MRAQPNLLNQYQDFLGDPEIASKAALAFEAQDNQKAEKGGRIHHASFGIGKIVWVGGITMAADFGTYGIKVLPTDNRAVDWL